MGSTIMTNNMVSIFYNSKTFSIGLIFIVSGPAHASCIFLLNNYVEFRIIGETIYRVSQKSQNHSIRLLLEFECPWALSKTQECIKS